MRVFSRETRLLVFWLCAKQKHTQNAIIIENSYNHRLECSGINDRNIRKCKHPSNIIISPDRPLNYNIFLGAIATTVYFDFNYFKF